jgi:hypothetical protein
MDDAVSCPAGEVQGRGYPKPRAPGEPARAGARAALLGNSRTFPRRAVEPCAERASRLKFHVVAVVPFWCVTQGEHGGGAGAPQRQARAVSNRRCRCLRGSRPVRCAGDPIDAAPSLGEPPRWFASSCCEPAFVPWTFVAGAGEWRGLAGRTHARHGHGFATSGGQRAGAPRRVARVAPSRGSRPSGHVFSLQGRERGLPGPKRTPARAMVAAAADAGCAAARRGERLREGQGSFPGCGRVKGRWASSVSWALGAVRPVGPLWKPSALREWLQLVSSGRLRELSPSGPVGPSPVGHFRPSKPFSPSSAHEP